MCVPGAGVGCELCGGLVRFLTFRPPPPPDGDGKEEVRMGRRLEGTVVEEMVGVATSLAVVGAVIGLPIRLAMGAVIGLALGLTVDGILEGLLEGHLEGLLVANFEGFAEGAVGQVDEYIEGDMIGFKDGEDVFSKEVFFLLGCKVGVNGDSVGTIYRRPLLEYILGTLVLGVGWIDGKDTTALFIDSCVLN